MTATGYLVSIVTDTATSEVPLLLSIIDMEGHSLLGGGGSENVRRTLLITPANNKTAKELMMDLEAFPGTKQITILPISDPVKASELSDIRKLYTQFKYNLKDVTDEQLTLYLTTHLKGEYTYVLDLDRPGKNEKGLYVARFRLTQEILDEHKNDPPPKIISRKTHSDGTEEVLMSFETTDTTEPPPPPKPPPLPKSAEIEKGFATVDDWLSNTIRTKKPGKPISEYGFSVFQLKEKYLLRVNGINMYPVESTKYSNYKESRDDFGPFYFQLPKAYQALSLEQARNKVATELKVFVQSNTFRQSYFAEANQIIFFSFGFEVIWTKK